MKDNIEVLISEQDVRNRIREMADIKDKSQKDVLTGLYNREYTEKLANEKLAHTGRGSLFMIDMDNFKIGQLIYRLRNEKHLTQLQSANQMNISDKTISKWERGVSKT